MSYRRKSIKCKEAKWILSFSWYWFDQILIITPGSANYEFWGKNKTKQQNKKNLRLCFWLNEECPKLLSSLRIDHRRRKTIPLWNSRGKKSIRASLYVWYLQYWALCDDLINFKLWAGVRYLSFSTDTAPECIVWKTSRDNRSLRTSRDGQSSSSSISPTLLVFRHLLQVQQAAVLWTFSIWLIWSFE